MGHDQGREQPVPGAIPDRFEVIEKIDATRVHLLYRAHDNVLQRDVLLKQPARQFRASEDGRDPREDILREARALAAIRHPAVARILDVIEAEDAPLLVFEPFTGESLAERTAREGRLDPQEVIAMGITLTEALELVHGAGIVHRGISADCIKLDPMGRVTLFGFDFAKPAPPGSSRSSLVYKPDASNAGLPPHPAPEQRVGGADDLRSDLFALAWVLFESLTGEAPYDTQNADTWSTPADACQHVAACPRALARALAQCLALQPAKRLPNAGALREALEAARTDSAASAGPTASAPPESMLRKRLVWVAAGALAAGLLALLVWGNAKEAPEPAAAKTVPKELRGLSLEEAVDGALAPHYAKSHALLIGIGKGYEGSGFPALPNAERDIRAVADTLRRQPGTNWQIETLVGKAATEDAVIDAIALLADRTADDDRVLIYFAGHGVAHERSENSGWMIPANAQPGKRSTWVRFDELFRFFGEAGAKHIMVALDCCYGGRLTSTRSARAQAYRERFLTKKAHVVVASGRGSEVVSDGAPGGHSPFAASFVKALQGSGPLTSTMLFAKIQHNFAATQLAQTPQFGYPSGSPIGGEFVFFLEER